MARKTNVMDKKLTLSLDKTIIESAKKLCQIEQYQLIKTYRIVFENTHESKKKFNGNYTSR